MPLTREKLREEIDGHGLVYDRATDYRRAVDEALFGLGEHRYEALINLLIQLRQPQLSKKPDEKLLSRALTEALPPLSPGLVTTVAEAFRGLDEERDALRALAEAGGAATEFLRHYRRYAQVAAKRKATGPRQAQSRYEQLGRDLTAAEEAYAAADAELQAAQRELEDLEQERTRLEARREALQQDPAMRDAGELDHRREEARRQDELARDREQARDQLVRGKTRRSVSAEDAGRHASAAGSELHAAQNAAAAAAVTARCAPGHHTAIESWREDLPQAKRDAQDVADRQAGAIGQLERLLAEVAARSSALNRRAPRRTAHRRDPGRQPTRRRGRAGRGTRRRGTAAAYRAYLRLGSPSSGSRSGRADRRPGSVGGDRRRRQSGGRGHRRRGPGGRSPNWAVWARELSARRAAHAGTRANSRERSNGCERAATMLRRFRIRGSPASATTVRARRCGR